MHKFKTWQLTKNKALELEARTQFGLIVVFDLVATPWTRDHWGLRFEVGLLGLHFCVMFYDVRHADELEDD